MGRRVQKLLNSKINKSKFIRSILIKIRKKLLSKKIILRLINLSLLRTKVPRHPKREHLSYHSTMLLGSITLIPTKKMTDTARPRKCLREEFSSRMTLISNSFWSLLNPITWIKFAISIKQKEK